MASRTRVNVFLALFLPILAIDAFHRAGPTHEALASALNDHLLAPLGLWQGPWRLYAPDVDSINLRLSAEIKFADQAVATWHSPDWTELSAAWKFVHARHIDYFNNILNQGHEPEWDALCAYLARTTPHPPGGSAPVESVSLILRGAIIPDPDDKLVPVGPYVDFDEPATIHVWRPTP